VRRMGELEKLEKLEKFLLRQATKLEREKFLLRQATKLEREKFLLRQATKVEREKFLLRQATKVERKELRRYFCLSNTFVVRSTRSALATLGSSKNSMAAGHITS